MLPTTNDEFNAFCTELAKNLKDDTNGQVRLKPTYLGAQIAKSLSVLHGREVNIHHLKAWLKAPAHKRLPAWSLSVRKPEPELVEVPPPTDFETEQVDVGMVVTPQWEETGQLIKAHLLREHIFQHTNLVQLSAMAAVSGTPEKLESDSYGLQYAAGEVVYQLAAIDPSFAEVPREEFVEKLIDTLISALHWWFRHLRVHRVRLAELATPCGQSRDEDAGIASALYLSAAAAVGVSKEIAVKVLAHEKTPANAQYWKSQ